MNKEDYEKRIFELEEKEEEREKKYNQDVEKIKSEAVIKMQKLNQKIQALEITVDMLSLRISARMPKDERSV
jgi:hypothetical protein